MASNSSNNSSSAAAGEETKDLTPTHTQAQSPRTFRRTWSTNTSPTCGQGGAPKCVCAPATHAGSFKCRLHRTNSHTHAAPMPRGPPSAVGGSSSRTVEAQ